MLGNDLGINIAVDVVTRPIIRPRGWQLSRGRHDAGELHGLIGPAALHLVALNEDLFASGGSAELRNVERSDVGDTANGGGAGHKGSAHAKAQRGQAATEG